MIRIFAKQTLLVMGMTFCLLPSVHALPAAAQDQNEFPGRRVGGGTRGDCEIDASSVVAVNPDSNLGVTSLEEPTLYFAVPKSAAPYEVTLVLQDEIASPVYETTLTAGAATELVGVQIPADTLEAGEYYHWYFVASCDDSNPAASVVLEGWLKQAEVEPESISELNSGLAQAQAYQAAGLWSDAIALTAELLAANPDCEEYQAHWVQLLTDLELETVIDDLLSVRLPSDHQ